MSNVKALKILYEDNHLISVFKPAGILTQSDRTGDICIMDVIKKYLKNKYDKQGNIFLGLLQRLDRPVSGIILFAKTSKGAARISDQFRSRRVEKIYHAIIQGKPKVKGKTGKLINYIKKFKTQNSKFRAATQNSEIDETSLYYEIVKFNKEYSLLKIKISTGKFHQIRIQLSSAGFPILGDVKYGGPKWHNPRAIALCATELSFISATKGNQINLRTSLPEEWGKYI